MNRTGEGGEAATGLIHRWETSRDSWGEATIQIQKFNFQI